MPNQTSNFNNEDNQPEGFRNVQISSGQNFFADPPPQLHSIPEPPHLLRRIWGNVFNRDVDAATAAAYEEFYCNPDRGASSQLP